MAALSGSDSLQGASFKDLITEARRRLNSVHISPSREKALTHTKLDEALLWFLEDERVRYGHNL